MSPTSSARGIGPDHWAMRMRKPEVHSDAGARGRVGWESAFLAVVRCCFLFALLVVGMATRVTRAEDSRAEGGALSPEMLAEISRANAICLDCHSLVGLELRLQELRTLEFSLERAEELLVEPGAFELSSHGEMKCVSCHVKGFDEHPHDSEAREEIKWCDDCHTRAFLVIEEQFFDSVHARQFEKGFSCSTCHDPHRFLSRDQQPSARAAVNQDNAMCLTCHEDSGASHELAPQSRQPLRSVSHAWLPNPDLHWEAARCVECHVNAEGKLLSHEIVDSERAKRECVACHSSEADLLVRLYKHRVGEERESAGFMNSIILNESYIVGATRNQVLDELSVLFAVLVLSMFSSHALVRVARWGWRQR